MNSIIGDNIFVIEQGIHLIEELPQNLFFHKEPNCYYSSVGEHLRHITDHYFSLIAGLDDFKVDYDNRNRDVEAEKKSYLAKEKLSEIIQALKKINPADLQRNLQTKMDTGEEQAWSQSSVIRELQFLLSHTVHHYALIATICQLNGYITHKTFGVAPSTLRYKQNQQS